MLNKMIRLIIPIVILSACIPTYQFTADEGRVKIKTLDTRYSQQAIYMCKDNKRYSIPTRSANKEHYIEIPEGKRIVLSASFLVSDAIRSGSCSSHVSFIPKEGSKYILDSNFFEVDRCYTVIVKEKEDTTTGVSFDESIQPVRASEFCSNNG